MSPRIESILKSHIERFKDGPLFRNEHGNKLDSNKELTRLINKFKAFFPMDKQNWGLHALRHSFAYNFLKKGGQMYQLPAILGHRSIDVTVDLYGQLQAQDIACPSPYEAIQEDYDPDDKQDLFKDKQMFGDFELTIDKNKNVDFIHSDFGWNM